MLDVLGAMRPAGVRRVPAVDGQGVLQGVLSFNDVVEIVGEEMSALVQVLASARRREPQRRP